MFRTNASNKRLSPSLGLLGGEIRSYKSAQIVDTHIHLWNPNLMDIPWLKGIDELNKTFWVED